MLQTDFLQKKVDISLEGLKDATQRFRTVFLLYNLAAILIFISIFNQNYSWQEKVNYVNRPYHSYVERVGLDADSISYNELRKHYANLYFDRQFFTVPLLGIKCSGSDLTVYAPIAMLIFSTWFFFAARRENHIMVEIERDFLKVKMRADRDKKENFECRYFLNYIYTGCSQLFVLMTVTKNDFLSRTNRIARPILEILMWMPLLILLYVLFSDVYDAILQWRTMRQHINEIVRLDGFLLFSCVLVTYQILYIKAITKNTAIILRNMRDVVKNEKYAFVI